MSEFHQTDTPIRPGPQEQIPQPEETWQKPRRLNPPFKSPVLAALFSMMPGMGQIYLGYYPQGFQNILVVAFIILLLNMSLASGLQAFLGFFIAFFWIFQMLDAWRRAHHVNRAMAGMAAEGLPEDFEMPGLKGSLPMGVLLIVLGALIFSDTKFGYSLEWLEEWWPVGLIIGGIWLVVRSRRK